MAESDEAIVKRLREELDALNSASKPGEAIGKIVSYIEEHTDSDYLVTGTNMTNTTPNPFVEKKGGAPPLCNCTIS